MQPSQQHLQKLHPPIQPLLFKQLLIKIQTATCLQLIEIGYNYRVVILRDVTTFFENKCVELFLNRQFLVRKISS